MARKERNEVDYFPHPVNHGKKMFYLRTAFGNDGYAVWFMLLEHLGKASYHYLDLSDEVELMYLSSEFKVSETVLKEIIKSLVKFGEFDKELWEENAILFNEKFIENISDAYKKRNNDCIDKNSLLTLLESKGIRKLSKSNPKPPKSSGKGDGNPQRILKDSIVKDIKEDNNTIPSFEVFKKYAIEKQPLINIETLKVKYDVWVELDWHDGNGKKILNWKTKILNTMKYMEKDEPKEQLFWVSSRGNPKVKMNTAKKDRYLKTDGSQLMDVKIIEIK